MNKPAFIAALIFSIVTAASGAAAQVASSNGETQFGGQSLQQSGTQAPITGAFCIGEMTATFCNVVTGPNTNGYGARGGSGPSGGAGAGSISASGGAGCNTSSIPPCSSEPPFNELCD